MKLSGFEFKKVIQSRFITALFFVSIAVCFLVPFISVSINSSIAKPAVRAFSDYSERPEAVSDYYENLESLALHQMLSGEDVNLPCTYDESCKFDDLAVLNTVFDRIEYLDGHNKQMSEISEKAARRISELLFFGLSPDSYEIRNEQRLSEVYTALKGTVSKDCGYSFGYEVYLNDNTLVFVILIFATVSAAWIFSNDYVNGAYQIMKASRYGSARTAASKLIVSFGITLFSTLAFSSATFIAVGSSYGFSSPFEPIQSLPGFYAVPFRCSIAGFILIQLGIRALSFTAYSFFISAIASLRIPYAGIFFAGALIISVNLVLFSYPYSGTAPAIRFLNFASMSEANPLTGFYRSISLFGVPVQQLSFMIGISVALTAFFATFSIMLFNRSFYIVPVKSPKTKANFPKKSPKPRGLIWAELKKSNFTLLLLIVFLLLFARLCVVKNEAGNMKQYREAVYYNYICDLKKTDDSDRYIETEQGRLDSIINAIAEYKAAFENGEVSREDYFEYLNRYEEAKIENSVFSDVKNYVNYIKLKNAETGFDGKVIYSSGYEKLINLSSDGFLFAALIVICSGVFYAEYKGAGFASVLRTMKYGRKRVFIIKMTLFMLFGGLVSFTFRAVDYLTVKTGFILPDGDSLLYSIESFSRVQSNFTINGFIFADFMAQLICGALLSGILCTLSLLLKNPIAYFGVSTICVLIPEILLNTIIKDCPSLSIVTFASPQDYILYGRYSNVCLYLTLIAAVFLLAASFFIATAWMKYVDENKKREKT